MRIKRDTSTDIHLGIMIGRSRREIDHLNRRQQRRRWRQRVRAWLAREINRWIDGNERHTQQYPWRWK